MQDKLIKIIYAKFKQEYDLDLPTDDPIVLQRTTESAQQAARKLKNHKEAEVNLPFIAISPSQTPLHLLFTITKEEIDFFDFTNPKEAVESNTTPGRPEPTQTKTIKSMSKPKTLGKHKPPEIKGLGKRDLLILLLVLSVLGAIVVYVLLFM